MSLRIAFDIDGVLADLDSSYRQVAQQLFGDSVSSMRPPGQTVEDPKAREVETSEPEQPTTGLALSGWQENEVWREIEEIDDFWTTLRPHEPGILRRIRDLSERHWWEIFFVTQRPDTAGETVQRQTQRWLVEHGFDLPSVLVLSGSRGRLAKALALDFLVDDLPRHCADVVSESDARAVLVLRRDDQAAVRGAREMGFEVTQTVSQALDLLERAQSEHAPPGLWKTLARTLRGGGR